jgi:hypothetical protein
MIIYHHMPRERRCLRHSPEHSNDIYLPNSSLIGDPDAVAWLRAARCTATGRHRASRAAIACTASLHRTPPFQAAKSKALLVAWSSPAVERQSLLWRSAKSQDLGCRYTLCSHGSSSFRAPTFGPKRSHAEGPRACDYVLGFNGFCRRPPCRPQSNRYQE